MNEIRSVLVIGEALIDIIHQGSIAREVPGGSPANVALGLGRLGTPTALLTAIGHDSRGRAIARRLESSGVSVLKASWSSKPTSTAEAALRPDGSAEYTFNIRWQLQNPLDAPTASHLHIGSIATFLAPGADQVAALVAARARGATVLYDPNIRPNLVGDPAPARSRFEQLCRLCDVVKLSDEDAGFLYPDLTPDRAAEAIGAVVPIVIITLGDKGSLLRHGDATVHIAATATTVPTRSEQATAIWPPYSGGC